MLDRESLAGIYHIYLHTQIENITLGELYVWEKHISSSFVAKNFPLKMGKAAGTLLKSSDCKN